MKNNDDCFFIAVYIERGTDHFCGNFIFKATDAISFENMMTDFTKIMTDEFPDILLETKLMGISASDAEILTHYEKAFLNSELPLQ